MHVQIRLLPVVIVLAIPLLALRSYDLGKGLTPPTEISVARVQAQQIQPEATPAAQVAQAGDTELNGAEGGDGERLALNNDSPETPVPVRRSEFLASPPEDLTQSEINVLQALSDRREELDRWEEELQQREALLQAAERRVDEKIAELTSLDGEIRRNLRLHDEQEQTRLTALVRIYETMNPKDAARIFEQLEMPVLLNVVERMKERRVAPILGEMDPNRAKAVTEELSQRNTLTVPRDDIEVPRE